MATSTTNLGLIKPAGTDKIRIAQINSNMDVIDTKMGAVGNTPLQTQITTLNTTADVIERGVAIRAIGNTHVAIAAGQFVYVRNHSTLPEGIYRANSAISANAALSTSNLVADSSGGLNSLKADIDTLIATEDYSATLSILPGDRGVYTNNVAKAGYTALGIIRIATTNNWMFLGSFDLSGNNVTIVIHNRTNGTESQTITYRILYVKNN